MQSSIISLSQSSTINHISSALSCSILLSSMRSKWNESLMSTCHPDMFWPWCHLFIQIWLHHDFPRAKTKSFVQHRSKTLCPFPFSSLFIIIFIGKDRRSLTIKRLVRFLSFPLQTLGTTLPYIYEQSYFLIFTIKPRQQQTDADYSCERRCSSLL